VAMSVVYTNFGGEVVHENRGGLERFYVPDCQGSTIALLDKSHTITDPWVYWPYGEIKVHNGSSTTPLTWLGTLGYFMDVVGKWFYVRARDFRADLARWLTVDPLWPLMPAYEYCGSAPTACNDGSGQNGRSSRLQLQDEGSNYGSCAVFYCSEHSGIFSIFGPPSHQYTCVRGPHGGCSGGLYPISGGWG